MSAAAHVEHATRGRARLRLPHLKGDASTFLQIQQVLRQCPGVMDVAVVGSLHLDIMVAAPRLPGRDETLMGSSWHRKCGGKGGNQAIAATRMGAKVAFGGAVGRDEFGSTLRDNLLSAGVDVSHLETNPMQGSGMSVAIEEEGAA